MSASNPSPSRRAPPPGAATVLAIGVIVAGAVWSQAPEGGADAAAKPADDPATLVAEMMPLATKSIIMDVCNGADRGIAVGERGHVLVSESRRDWRQVDKVPTRSTLTACTAVGSQAWAVGHDGMILHSGDGGLTWERQRVAAYDANVDDLHNGTPLLDVLFLDDKRGLAVGAYAMVLRTEDGGATWTDVALTGGGEAADGADAATPADDGAAPDDGADAAAGDAWTFDQSELDLEEETDPHLNAIARTGDGSLFVVAERGAAFRSTDGGATWQRLKLPYDGSMFGVIGYEDRHVLAFGLRGNVFESRDLGDTWKKIDTGVDLTIMGGAGWGNGGAALVGANGVVLTRSGSGENLLRHDHPDKAVLSSAVSLAAGGDLVVAGENGIGVYTPN